LFDDIATLNVSMPKHLLIVEDNEIDASQIAKMLYNGDLIELTIARTGRGCFATDV